MQVEAEFDERWNAGTVQGWEDKGVGTEQTSSREQPLVDVDDYDSVEELMELGPERLKEVHLPYVLVFDFSRETWFRVC